MEQNEQNLEMGIFGDTEMELNLGETLEDMTELTTTEETSEETTTEETTTVEESTTPDEDVNPEDVVGEEGDNEGSGDDTTSPNLYSSFASTLQEKGVLPSLDLDKTDIKDTDSLATVIKGEIDVQVKQYLVNKLGEEGFDALEKGVSLAQYQEHTETVEALGGITDEKLTEDQELSKRVILQDYINQGLTEVRAKKILQKTIDLGEEAILEDAQESIKSLRLYEANRIEQEKVANKQRLVDEAQHQEKIDNDLKNAIYNQKEFIKGIEVNKTIQDRVYKSITEVVGESPQGVMENKLMRDRRENPIEFDAKLYYLYEITNEFEDFSKLTSKAAAKAATDFEKVLRQTRFAEAGAPTFTVDKDSYEGIGSEVVID